MSIKIKLLAMVSVPILALLIISVLGLTSFWNIEKTIERVNSLHMDRASMINADRDAYQAQVALVQAGSAKDAEALGKARQDSDTNLAQTWERMSGPAKNFTPDMTEGYANFERNFNKWKQGNVGALEISTRTLGINTERIMAENAALAQYDAMRGSIDKLGELAENELEQTYATGASSQKRQAALGRALSSILNADRDAYQAYVALLLMPRTATQEELADRVKSYEENTEQTRERVTKGADLIGAEAGNLKEEFLGLFNAWNRDGRHYIQLTKQGFEDNLNRDAMLEESEAAFTTMRGYIDRLGEAEAGRVETDIADMNQSIRTTIMSYMIIASVFVLAAIALALLMSTRIAKAVKDSSRAALQITEGNFDIDLAAQGKDETAQLQSALNTMASTLSQNIAEIRIKTEEAEEKAEQARKATAKAEEAMQKAEVATRHGILQAAESLEGVVERVATASEELSQQGEILSRGSESQAARIQETATAMEEMNTTVLEIARNASETATSSQEAMSLANKGSAVVEESMTAMAASVQEVHSLKGSMNELEDQAKGIGTIIGVINDIADQTNLLALNAAIEAARAGEAGRGFAVVADEVRKLAEKTMSATKEVGDSVTAIQKVASENLGSMDNVFDRINTANDNAVRSAEVLQTIVAASESSAAQIDSIATAAEEQSATSEEINISIEDINQVTMENARGVAESTNALNELAQQMSDLKAIVERLKEEGEGESRTALPEPEITDGEMHAPDEMINDPKRIEDITTA